MAQNATDRFTMRINPELKGEAAAVFEELGLDMTTAITIFLKKSVKTRSIPFEVNDMTREAALDILVSKLEKAEAQIARGEYYTLDEMRRTDFGMVAETGPDYDAKKA